GAEQMATVGVERRETATRARRDGRRVLAPDTHHGSGAAHLAVLQGCGLEAGGKGPHARHQLKGGEHVGRVAPGRSGRGDLRGPGAPAAIVQGLVLYEVNAVMEGKHRRTEGHDDVKGQAD